MIAEGQAERQMPKNLFGRLVPRLLSSGKAVDIGGYVIDTEAPRSRIHLLEDTMPYECRRHQNSFGHV